MKIYVVETIGDYVEQCGVSLCKNTAKRQADRLTEKAQKNGGRYRKYWVTEYEITNNQYVEFDD